LVSIWMYLYDAPPFYEEIPIEEGEHIEIAGQIYQKEYRSYYVCRFFLVQKAAISYNITSLY